MDSNEPVAWAVVWPQACDGRIESEWVYDNRRDAEETVAGLPEARSLVPLYRQPQPTLTNEEREAVEWAEVAAMVDAANETDADDAVAYERRAATLRVLRERLS